jgi:hypothetical protein
MRNHAVSTFDIGSRSCRFAAAMPPSPVFFTRFLSGDDQEAGFLRAFLNMR